MPAENMAVEAQWVMDTSFVEIVFGKKDLTEDEISEALKKHTNADFTIERIETDKAAGTTVATVKFKDPEEASKFVGKVEDEVKSGENEDYLRDASLVKQGVSYSHDLHSFWIMCLVCCCPPPSSSHVPVLKKAAKHLKSSFFSLQS